MRRTRGGERWVGGTPGEGARHLLEARALLWFLAAAPAQPQRLGPGARCLAV